MTKKSRSRKAIIDRLLDRNIIAINETIDAETEGYIRNAILYLIANGSPDITLLIASSGGSVMFGLHIYDILKLYQGKIEGIVLDRAFSMGAIVLQVCDTRKATHNSRLLIHNIYKPEDVTLEKLRNEEYIKQTIEGLEASENRLYRILNQRTGHPIKEIKKECAKNRQMTAEQALDFGLIDEIIDEAISF